MVSQVEQSFRALYGQPCWPAKRGYGGFLTFEFGEPHLEVDEPRLSRYVFSPKRQEKVLQRLVTVHGDWHLWVYCCDWSIAYHGRQLARFGSRPQRVDHALTLLDGQALTTVSVAPQDGSTTFPRLHTPHLALRPQERTVDTLRGLWVRAHGPGRRPVLLQARKRAAKREPLETHSHCCRLKCQPRPLRRAG